MNNPLYIADYFLNCVERLKGTLDYIVIYIATCNNLLGCPRVLRTDLGTENSNIAFLQPILRHYHGDSLSGNNSHHYGKSTSN